MYLEHLWLTDFRSYTDTEFSPSESGITVVTGANGAGKTNLIEAVCYLSRLRSLRGSPSEALVRSGCSTAVIRSVIRHRGSGRRITVDAELHAAGRDRVVVNGQALRRHRDLLGALQVTVFSPDDLAMVKGGPSLRRTFLDDLLVALEPRHDTLLGELDRILRQRNALLRSAQAHRGRNLPDDIVFTLDVWDSKLAVVGEELATARSTIGTRLEPMVGESYGALAAGSAGRRREIGLVYRRSWSGLLAEALVGARGDDLRRGVTTTGPQRDEMDLEIGGLPARTHGSQGEQRTLALALRLAGHRLLCEETGSSPVLLLDDVFSELDRERAEALMHNLPPGQAILTTAGVLPPGASPSAWFTVDDGKVLPGGTLL